MTDWTAPQRQWGQVDAATLNTQWRDNTRWLAENLNHQVSFFHRTSLVESGNAITRVNVPGQWYLSAWKQSTSADGDEFTHSFECRKGTYTITILCRKTANSGLVDWELDGVSIDTGMDFYNASTQVNQQLVIEDVVIGTPGRHVLTGTVNGTSGGAGAYDVEITKISAVWS